jgi:toxin ParE1/3/4
VRKKYHVDISSRAEEDILAFTAYIGRDKPGAAAKWARRVASRIRSLANFPERFASIPESIESNVLFRHHVFGKYRIIYR